MLSSMVRLDSNPLTPPPQTNTASRQKRLFLFGLRGLLCALSSSLAVFACATFDVWPLAWISLLPLLFVLLNTQGVPQTRHPTLWGWWMGTLMIMGGFAWMLPFFMRFAHLPLLASLPLFVLFSAYHGLVVALFSKLLCFFRKHLDVSVTWLAPLLWVVCEFCFPCIFPWYLAITQAWNVPVIQIAEFTGPLGVSFVLALTSGALFDVITAAWRKELRWNTLRSPLFAGLFIVGSLVVGKIRIEQVSKQRAQADKIRIGMVQPNVSMEQKFKHSLQEQLHKLHEGAAALEKQGVDLLIWPETSYPYKLSHEFSQDFSSAHLHQIRRGFQAPLLFGAVTDAPNPESWYNTVFFLNKQNVITGRVDKNFLLVFGEYLPYGTHLRFLKDWIPDISLGTPGTQPSVVPFLFKGRQYYLGPLVCYEDIMPSFGRRLFAGKHPPHLLINLTNDAWFGDTAEPYEHLALSVFRAIEHRVDLVRSTNTGVSAFIDATGRLYAQTNVVDLQKKDVPVTLLHNTAALMVPSGFYQIWGDSFGFVCLGIVLLLGVLARLRARKSVRWLYLLISSALLHLCVFAAALCLPSLYLYPTYAALVHRNEALYSEDDLFRATWLLTLVLGVASGILGFVLERFNQRHAMWWFAEDKRPNARLEILTALSSVTIIPVILWGRMEGNTAAVVVVTGLCALCALLGESIALRLAKNLKMRKSS